MFKRFVTWVRGVPVSEDRVSFEGFTDRAQRAVRLTQDEARLLNHNFIGTGHILLGLIHEGEGVAAKTLEALGISLGAARAKVGEIIGPVDLATTESPPLTPRAKKVLELARREALQLGHKYIDTEHVLLGVVREGEGVAAQVLIGLGADLSRIRQQVIQRLVGPLGQHQRSTPSVQGLPANIDSRLVFRSTHCDGDHYLVGNAHTFPGRMVMWCEVSSRELSVSLFEITSASDYAQLWIDGYLAGNEPPPPQNDDPSEEEAWQRARRAFRTTGDWPTE